MEYDKEETEILIENFKEEYGNNLLDLVYYLSIPCPSAEIAQQRKNNMFN